MPWSRVFVRLVSHAICIAYIIYNLFMLDAQFLQSNEFAEKLQRVGPNSFLHYFLLIITDLGFPGTLIFAGIIAILHPQKRLASRIIFFYVLIGYIVGVLKMLFAYPRPWFVDDDIIVYNCSNTDFGMPSGHAFSSFFSVFLPYYKYIYGPMFQQHYSEASSFSSPDTTLPTLSIIICNDVDKGASVSAPPPNQRIILSILFLALLVIFVFLVGFSRIYLGDHSYGQVLLGWSLAMICFVECVYYFDEQLDKFMELLLKKSWNTRKWFVPLLVFCYFLTIGTPVGLQLKNNAQGAFKPEWIANIQQRCPDSPSESEIVGRSFNACASGILCFGSIIGVMFAPTNFFENEYFEISRRSITKKFVGGIILGVAGAAIYFGIPLSDPWSFFLVKLNLLFLVLPVLLLVVIPSLWKYLLKEESKICDSNLSMEMQDSQIKQPTVPYTN